MQCYVINRGNLVNFLPLTALHGILPHITLMFETTEQTAWGNHLFVSLSLHSDEATIYLYCLVCTHKRSHLFAYMTKEIGHPSKLKIKSLQQTIVHIHSMRNI